MRLHTLLLTSHAIAAGLTAIISVFAFQSGSLAMRFTGLFACAVMTVGAALFGFLRIRRGLNAIEEAANDHERSIELLCGLEDLDAITQKVGRISEQWEGVAASSREQSREFQMMLQMLNRRGTGRKATSHDLRSLLGSLGVTLHSQWQKFNRGAETIESKTRAITDGAEEQRHSVLKTTAYVEKLSTVIEQVSDHNQAAMDSLATSDRTATEIQASLTQVSDTMRRLRSQSQTCEKKLRGLNDPSQQINAILGTIGEITARTQMLALNASIESIRAGEHGKEFAMVADEVRGLAEQATDATREISSLVESMQLVTRESVEAFSRQSDDLEAQAGSVAQAATAVGNVVTKSEAATGSLQAISDASTEQLKLAAEIVMAVEEISQLSKEHGENAESVCWTMRNLSAATPELSDAIKRLRNCSDDLGIEIETPATPVAHGSANGSASSAARMTPPAAAGQVPASSKPTSASPAPVPASTAAGSPALSLPAPNPVIGGPSSASLG